MFKLIGRLYFLPATWPGREIRNLNLNSHGQVEERIFKKLIPFFYVRTH